MILKPKKPALHQVLQQSSMPVKLKSRDTGEKGRVQQALWTGTAWFTGDDHNAWYLIAAE